MDPDVITNPHQLTNTWLNAALTRSGALRAGSARAFEAEQTESTWARMVPIRLSYEEGSQGALPERLLLKICADEAGTFGPSEVHYYTRDYAGLAGAPIPPCYDARYADNPRRYHILMEDLSETHRNNWRVEPTLEYGYGVAQALARLHAHRWGEARLREIDAAIPGAPELDRYMGQIRQGLAPMLENVRDEIDSAWQQAILQVFERHPAAMLDRARDPAGFTLMHGDVNPGNILSPRDGPGPTYLIDRQPFDWSLTTWLAASDLAYWLVLWWEPGPRRRWELPVLRRYHERLLQLGVTDYPWESLLRDYRLSAIQALYVAVEWCALEEDREKMKWVWFRELQRSMLAFFDLDCAALLSASR